jgi:D-glycero-D-manno-heptose 1,7-bisphosphate phosphatase
MVRPPVVGGGPGVFLDRDGVLNRLVERDGGRYSPRRLSEFELYPDSAACVDRLRRLGIPVFGITNQPDLARGRMDRSEHEAILAALEARVALTELVVCPHDDRDGCPCRKPKPGMILDLAERWSVDLSKSIVVGDSWRDIEAGRAAGARTVYICDASTNVEGADVTVGSLDAAVAYIESYLSGVPPR